jgi:acetoin utilization deacetylase AcuC-like enzyme
MSTALFTHPDCVRHEMSEGHPERPARIGAILDDLEREGLIERLDRVEPTAATREQLARAHGGEYIDLLFEHSPQSGMVQLDADTAMNPHSLSAALMAAGAGVQAVDRVIAGDNRNAFCCVRPPGHHAERNTAMGFCFFSSIAVAALHALQHQSIERVAIVDFDVHHGNGTEDIVADNDQIFFCSTFQYPFYPGKYGDNVAGRVVNVPLPGGTDGSVFRQVMERDCLPALRDFNADLIFISAGFDAHTDDLLGGLNFVEDDFAWITGQLLEVAAEQCDGRVVSMLEGGYDLASLGRSASAHVRVLLEQAG